MGIFRNKWSLKNTAIAKLLVLGIIIFIIFSSIIYMFTERFHDHLVELRKNELKHLVEIGYNSITDIIDDYELGRLSFNEARNKVRNTVRKKTYTDKENMNYLFMSSYDGIMMVQPFQPEKEGTSQWDLIDSRGTYIIRELVKIAKSDAGEGYVVYYYPPPGKEKGEEKISYVKGIESLKMYIGTGIYSSDINGVVNDQMIVVILVMTLMFGVLIGFIVISLKPLLSGYDDMKNLFIKVRNDPFTIPEIPYKKYSKRSETYNLLETFDNMLVERYENNIKLRISETKYRKLLEAMRDGYVMSDTNGNILEFNNAFRDMTGYSREELLTMTFFDITPHKWHSYEMGLLNQEFLERGYTDIYEKEYIKKDGTLFPVELRAYMIENHLGNEIAMWAIVKDITERKKYENSLKDLNKRLEISVDERTRELNKTISELKKAHKKLIESEKNSLIVKLVSGVAHEINTPVGVGLTAVSSLSKDTHEVIEKLNTGKLGKSQFKDYLEKTQNACEIIEDNLNISRDIVDNFKKIYVNQNSHEKKKINLGEYIGEVLDTLLYRIKNNDIKLNYHHEEVITELYLDDITQIITNLLLNSLNHGFDKDKSGEINVNVFKRDNNCVIQFGDDGKGISGEIIDDIFEPFFTTSRITGGMGLGLNIVKNIVNQSLLGDITVKSQRNKYTEFSIVFPISNKPD